MATFERERRVDAPLAEAWSFHSTIDGLLALTPNWLHLRVEEIERPNEDADSDVLTAGSRIRASVQPFGVGPRQTAVSRIVEREEGDGTAYFVDVMEDGPFPEWEHTHLLYGNEDETLIRDHVEYRTALGGVADTLAVLGLAPMFRFRHRRTSEILEDA